MRINVRATRCQSRYPDAEAEIDQEALAAFVALSPVVGSIDRAIASSVGLGVVRSEWDNEDDLFRKLHDDFIKHRVSELRLLGVDTIKGLKRLLRHYETDIIRFASKYLERPIADRKVGGLVHGMSVHYLTRILAGRTLDVQDVRKYLRAGSMLFLEPSGEEEEARWIIEIIESIDQEPS
jgi:hypothetical protein